VLTPDMGPGNDGTRPVHRVENGKFAVTVENIAVGVGYSCRERSLLADLGTTVAGVGVIDCCLASPTPPKR
jgi:hypothetical protein